MKNDTRHRDSDEPPERSSNIVDFKPVARFSATSPSHAAFSFSQSAKPRRRAPRLVIGERANAFRKRCYPGVSASEWNDWRWQNRSRIRSAVELQRVVKLSDDEREAVARHSGPLPVGIPPYYASLLDRMLPTSHYAAP